MKQLFAIFLMVQLWATPAYAALLDCVEHFAPHSVSSSHLDMEPHSGHAMNDASKASEQAAFCEHCEGDSTDIDRSLVSNALQEACANVSSNTETGLTPSRDQLALLPFTSLSVPNDFGVSGDWYWPTESHPDHSKTYLRTLRIRL